MNASPPGHLNVTGARLLRLLAHRGEGLGVSAREWLDIVALASAHGVAPCLHRALQEGAMLDALPEAAQATLVEERRLTALANLRHYGELKRIASALRARGIDLIPLKGLHLAERVYRDIGLRPMSDLDVLVPRARVAETVGVLRGMDYGFDAELGSAAGAMLGEKCNLGLAHRRDDVWLEVHWSLDEPPDAYADVVAAIWESATAGNLADTEVKLMRPEFLLLHVCAHLACNHGFAFSLRALCDIREILRRFPALDWQLLTAYGDRPGWRRGVAAALRLACDHLDAPAPREALAALGADALEAARLHEAIEHVVACTAMPEPLHTAPNLLAISDHRSPWRSAALVARRLLVPRAELALLYGVPADSWRLPMYYALRLRDLGSRYAGSAWKLFTDRGVHRAAGRHARLAEWIDAG